MQTSKILGSKGKQSRPLPESFWRSAQLASSRCGTLATWDPARSFPKMPSSTTGLEVWLKFVLLSSRSRFCSHREGGRGTK